MRERGKGERDTTCCHPLSSVITRFTLPSPVVTHCHPLPLVNTRYYPLSPVVNRCDPSSTVVIRYDPSFGRGEGRGKRGEGY